MNPLSHPESPAPSGQLDTPARWAVLIIWLICSLATFGFVFAHCSDVPWGDEYDIVPVVTGQQPFSLDWLWSPHNEHRIPLPRLVRFGLLGLTGTDFRSSVYAITALLSGLGLATALAAARIRGRFTFTDAFFPLVWLHWGQVENLLWGFQLQFLLSVLLTTVVLLIIVLRGRDLTPGLALFVACCLLLLPLCGSNGALTALPLAIWLGYSALVRAASHRPGSRAGFALVLLLSVGVVVLAGVYFWGLPTGRPVPPGTTVWAQVQVALAFLSSGLGPEFDWCWWVAGLFLFSLLLAVLVVAFRAARQQREETPRAFGLIATVCTFLLLAVAVGHARVAFGVQGGLQSRYSTLLIPALCTAYYTGVLYLPEKPAWSAQVALLVIASVMQLNANYASAYAGSFDQRRAAFCHDLEAGVPSFVLAEDYYHHPFGLFPSDPGQLDRFFGMLHDAAVGRFAQMAPSPPYERLALTPSTGTHEQGVIRLHTPRHVHAIGIVWSCDGPPPGHSFMVQWRNSRYNNHSQTERNAVRHVPAGQVTAAAIRVDDVINEVRFATDGRPGELIIHGITFLVGNNPAPESGEGGQR
jgi:hypothetical protein